MKIIRFTRKYSTRFAILHYTIVCLNFKAFPVLYNEAEQHVFEGNFCQDVHD